VACVPHHTPNVAEPGVVGTFYHLVLRHDTSVSNRLDGWVTNPSTGFTDRYSTNKCTILLLCISFL